MFKFVLFFKCSVIISIYLVMSAFLHLLSVLSAVCLLPVKHADVLPRSSDLRHGTPEATTGYRRLTDKTQTSESDRFLFRFYLWPITLSLGGLIGKAGMGTYMGHSPQLCELIAGCSVNPKPMPTAATVTIHAKIQFNPDFTKYTKFLIVDNCQNR